MKVIFQGCHGVQRLLEPEVFVDLRIPPLAKIRCLRDIRGAEDAKVLSSATGFALQRKRNNPEIAANPFASSRFRALGVVTHNVVPARQAGLRAVDGQGSRVCA